jgi:hypothetical protein
MNTSLVLVSLVTTILGFVWIFYIFKLIGLISKRDKNKNETSGTRLFFQSFGHILGLKWKHNYLLEIKALCKKMRYVLITYIALFIYLIVSILNLANA